ncbi:MAG: hypothetical protein R3C16_02405 [Hyphomonadaceae bacterium]
MLCGDAAEARGPEDTFGIEVSGHSAFYRGDYKLVRTPAPLGDGAWRLYDIAADPGETNDLAAAQPDLLATMIAGYEAYAERVGVLPLPPAGTCSSRWCAMRAPSSWNIIGGCWRSARHGARCWCWA